MPSGITSLAMVTPFYPPHVGGVERYVQEFARAAITVGLSVNVVTTDAGRTVTEAVEDGRIRVLRLPARNVPIMGSHYPVALSGWRRARDFLDCDVILAHTRFFMTTLAAANVTRDSGTPLCVLDHGAGPLRSSPTILALASLAYEHAATALLKRLKPKFFAVSAASAAWLRTFGIYEAEIIPNSVSPRPAPPQRRAVDVGGTIVVFYAGRLLREKGILELVEGVNLLRGKGRDVELRIAGDGPLAQSLTTLASKNRSFSYLGRIAPERVEDELERATVFVHPSQLPEGLPTMLLEAGRAGLPVISTPFGGSAELIRDGQTGWIIPSGDAECIAHALEGVAAQPWEASRRGIELFRLVQENYTWPTTVRKFLRYLERAHLA
jgi:glycosyltransferase involved in cell wall biosynthesis